LNKYRVFTNDFTFLKANWQRKLTQNPNPCADIDHQGEGLNKYRVFTNDFTLLKKYWQKRDTQLNPGGSGGTAPCPVVDTARWL